MPGRIGFRSVHAFPERFRLSPRRRLTLFTGTFQRCSYLHGDPSTAASFLVVQVATSNARATVGTHLGAVSIPQALSIARIPRAVGNSDITPTQYTGEATLPRPVGIQDKRAQQQITSSSGPSSSSTPFVQRYTLRTVLANSGIMCSIRRSSTRCTPSFCQSK